MTDVYKQEEIHEETIAQRDARLKKANETARREEILGLMSQLNPTTGEVALCGDVAGHEFHGNQYTGGSGGSGGGGDHADREDERVAKRHEKEEYDHGVGAGKYADKSPREKDKLLKERKAQIEREEYTRAEKEIRKSAGKPSGRDGAAAETVAQHEAAMKHHDREADKARGRGDEKAAKDHDNASELHSHAASMLQAGYPEGAKWSAKAREASTIAQEHGPAKGKAHDSPERAKAEGAETAKQHTDARDYHDNMRFEAKSPEARRAHEQAWLAHDQATLDRRSHKLSDGEKDQSSKAAQKASAAAHAAEDSHRSGKK